MKTTAYWMTRRGIELRNMWIAQKREFEAALSDPINAPAPVSYYRNQFAITCYTIGMNIATIDAVSSRYYLALAKQYGYTA